MKIHRFLLLLLAVGIIGFAGTALWLYVALTTPKSHTNVEEYIVIEKGSTPDQIITKLESEGIINNRLPTLLYLRTIGNAGKLQAGEYLFPSPVTPIEVLSLLEKGSTRTKRLTIPEGFTRLDIAQRIVELFPQSPPAEEKQILLLMDDTSLINEIAPQAQNLEGYLFPSTYNFPPDAKTADILSTMVEQFKKVWRSEWTDQAKQLGRTPHEIITIASLIETETPIESERPIVASVIYNRLSRNIPLGIDQTAVYIAKMENRWDKVLNKSDLDSKSPYNTRKYAGLPPGPIASVSASSITAALYPETTDYIFYVRNVQINDGSHHFYASAAEFEKGKAEYQRWLGEERKKKRKDSLNK